MKVVYATISFHYQGKKFTGQVSMFTPAKTLLLRVYVDLKEWQPKEKERVFTFWKQSDTELFWFDLPKGWKQEMAWKIARQLLKLDW